MDNIKRTAARIAGRDAALELFGTLAWEDHTGAEFGDGFLRKMRELLPVRKDAPKPKKLSLIAQLGTTTIDFGVLIGRSYDEVTLGHLRYCQEAQERSAILIAAYLNHPDVDQWRLKQGSED